MLAKLDGILFLCGDEGITREELKIILAIDDQQLDENITQIKEMCQSDERGIQVEEYGAVFKYVTKAGHEEIYKKLVQVDLQKPLTQSALEVLAIIAYNQPITRLEIDQLRGVSSAHLIRRLLLKELICEADRADTPGRPIIYKTTTQFLDALGIKDLNQLPAVKETLKEAEMALFSQKINEN